MHVVLAHDLLELGAGHVHGAPPGEVGEEELGVNCSMLRWTQVRKEGCHLVKGSSSHGFVVSGGGKVVSNALLMIP